VLVKHAQPVLDPEAPPREWQLSAEGEAQSVALAERLRAFLPFALVSSKEPKATATAAIVSAALGVPHQVMDGLEEFDRPPMPILSAEEHDRVNAMLFEKRDVPVLGRESAHAALARFDAAITSAFETTDSSSNLVVIAHGTVIALFVEHHTGREAVEVWRGLRCADYVTVRGVGARLARRARHSQN
jgi:broad specificity phosphatase PhoE